MRKPREIINILRNNISICSNRYKDIEIPFLDFLRAHLYPFGYNDVFDDDLNNCCNDDYLDETKLLLYGIKPTKSHLDFLSELKIVFSTDNPPIKYYEDNSKNISSNQKF